MRVLGLCAALVAMVALCAVCGYLAGPVFARTSLAVRRARLPWSRVMDARPDETNEDRALRMSGKSREQIRAAAVRVERRFRKGGAAFGAWCGVVVAAGILSLRRRRRRAVYEVNPGLCVACGRCFMYCPRERLCRRPEEGCPPGSDERPQAES